MYWCKNNNFSKFVESKFFLNLVTIKPAVEKSRSLSEEVAGADKYLDANFVKSGHFSP
jgi:hypothetical protein